MLFLLAFFSFLKVSQFLIICFVNSKLSKLITHFPEFGICLFFYCQQVGKFHLQTLDSRQLLYAHFVKSLFRRFVDDDVCLVFLQKLF